MISRAIAMVPNIHDNAIRAEALHYIARRIRSPIRHKLLSDAIDIVKTLDDDVRKSQIIVSIATQRVSDSDLLSGQLDSAVYTIASAELRASTLQTIVSLYKNIFRQEEHQRYVDFSDEDLHESSSVSTNTIDIDATLEEELTFLEMKWGKEALRREYIRRASADVGAPDQGMGVGAQVKETKAETTVPHPQLSDADLAEFMAYAKADKNQWISRLGVAPSEHIATKFTKWLGKGLMREHVAEAQPNLAMAYAREIGRHPDRKVEGLGARPAQKLQPGAPRPPSRRPVAELSETEQAERRHQKNEQQRRWRAKRADLS
jgi:hypothetical protein